MIYIDFHKNIHPCLFCESHEKMTCDCDSLKIFVYEDLLFACSKGSFYEFFDPNHQKYMDYQKSKKCYIKELKEKYPLAKKFIFYPYVHEK